MQLHFCGSKLQLKSIKYKLNIFFELKIELKTKILQSHNLFGFEQCRAARKMLKDKLSKKEADKKKFS